VSVLPPVKAVSLLLALFEELKEMVPLAACLTGSVRQMLQCFVTYSTLLEWPVLVLILVLRSLGWGRILQVFRMVKKLRDYYFRLDTLIFTRIFYILGSSHT
jgi:hypothetical protein